MSPPPHIQRAFPKSPMTSWPPGWMEKDRNDLRCPAGNGSKGTQFSSPRGSKEAPRRHRSGVRVSTSPRALARTYQSTPFIRAKPGKEKGRGGPEKRPQEGRGIGGVGCVCVSSRETPRPERPCIQAARVAAGESSVRPASPTSHLPLRRRALLRISRHPRCPRETGLGPRTPSVHPLRSAVRGGGEARR